MPNREKSTGKREKLAEAGSLTERNEKSNCKVSMERCGRWVRTWESKRSSSDRTERESG